MLCPCNIVRVTTGVLLQLPVFGRASWRLAVPRKEDNSLKALLLLLLFVVCCDCWFQSTFVLDLFDRSFIIITSYHPSASPCSQTFDIVRHLQSSSRQLLDWINNCALIAQLREVSCADRQPYQSCGGDICAYIDETASTAIAGAVAAILNSFVKDG